MNIVANYEIDIAYDLAQSAKLQKLVTRLGLEGTSEPLNGGIPVGIRQEDNQYKYYSLVDILCGLEDLAKQPFNPFYGSSISDNP